MYKTYENVRWHLESHFRDMFPHIQTILNQFGGTVVVSIHNKDGYTVRFEKSESGEIDARIYGKDIDRFYHGADEITEEFSKLILTGLDDEWELERAGALHDQMELMRKRLNEALDFAWWHNLVSEETFTKAFESFRKEHISGRSYTYQDRVPELNWKAYCLRFGEDYNDTRARDEELSSVSEVYRISHELYNELYYRGEKVLAVKSADSEYCTFYWFRRGTGFDLKDEEVFRDMVLAHYESPIKGHSIDKVVTPTGVFSLEDEPDEYHIRVPHITVEYRTFLVNARGADEAYDIVKKNPDKVEYEDDETMFEAFDWNNVDAYNVSGDADLSCNTPDLDDWDDDDEDDDWDD